MAIIFRLYGYDIPHLIINNLDIDEFLSMNLATFVHSDQREEEDEVDKLFGSLTELVESLITGQYTTSSENSGRTTISTATETSITMEPTTTLQASSNDVCSHVAYSSHDALDHAQPRMTFATVNKEVLQTFADKMRNYNTKKDSKPGEKQETYGKA